jgi:hypothetical protein
VDAGGNGPVPAPADGSTSGTPAAVAVPVHRLRDLDRRGRVWAGLFAIALLLAPVLAFAWAAPDWVPAGDPALMAVRALDVGTSRMPLTGQPSTSGFYGGAVGGHHVAHPGPLHFYVLALPVRLLGPALGMLVVSLANTAGCVLVAAWATFRQLGALGGVVGAVVLSLITFTTGASSLVNPVSSNIAGYPVLCALVLLWCLTCGDLRLLPLTVAVLSFAAQQHLSSLPVMVVVTAAVVVASLVGGWRTRAWLGERSLRTLAVWGGWSAALGLVLWSPVLVQQVTGPGNLTAMVRFAGNGDRPSLGPGASVRQLAHALGLPPLLGRTRLDGHWLLADVGPFTWASAAVVAALVAAAGVRWRRSHPRRAALALMVGFVAVGGLVNGSSVPDGLEQYRLVFYHWTFALAFFVTLTLGVALVDTGRRVSARPAGGRPPSSLSWPWRTTPAWAGTAAAGVALAAIVVPASVNPALDRPSNTLAAASAPVEREVIERLADDVLAHVDTSKVTLAYGRDDVPFIALRDALALELIDRGFAVRFPPPVRWFVDDDRLAEPADAEQALVLQVDDATPEPRLAGRLVAQVDLSGGFDWDAYEELLRRAAEPIPLGQNPVLEAALDALRPTAPRLVDRVEATMPTVTDPGQVLGVQVYVLTPSQLRAALAADTLD